MKRKLVALSLLAFLIVSLSMVGLTPKAVADTYDWIGLYFNPLNADSLFLYIPALQERNVKVVYDEVSYKPPEVNKSTDGVVINEEEEDQPDQGDTVDEIQTQEEEPDLKGTIEEIHTQEVIEDTSPNIANNWWLIPIVISICILLFLALLIFIRWRKRLL